jgi:hypothetical protein
VAGAAAAVLAQSLVDVSDVEEGTHTQCKTPAAQF